MTQQQLDAFKQWFTDYVRRFYTADDTLLNDHIRLKECHTHRVCKEMRDLAEALKMDAEQTRLAEAIALLHDVGRFPQFQQYRTYKDTISENHCLLALKVLAEHKVLDVLDADERAIIEQAVEFHGAKALPALDEPALTYAKMIRDADKIDIFELLSTNYRVLAEEPERFTWEMEFPDIPECSPAIIEAILNQQLIGYDKIRTVNDAQTAAARLGCSISISTARSNKSTTADTCRPSSTCCRKRTTSSESPTISWHIRRSE